MAITPRTVLSNPATAAMTVASVLAVSALGIYSMKSCAKYSGCKMRKAAMERRVNAANNPCEQVRQDNGFDKSSWSEFQWFKYASCFANQNNSRSVIDVTTQGINYYPRSEALFNLKGYHQIELREHDEAVKTLTLGLKRVGRPTSGTMANNLAWAGLWAPRELTLEQARESYQRSLRVEPNVCETIHTGMWVEYGIIKQGQGFARVDAMRNFNLLSEQYTACHNRANSHGFKGMVEVLGAAVMMSDLSASQGLDATSNTLLMQNLVRGLGQDYNNYSTDTLCRESIPLATAHHTCIKVLDDAKLNTKQVRHHRHPRKSRMILLH